MDVITTVLLFLAAFIVLALVGAAVFLIVQKRNIERFAIERADELIAENAETKNGRGTVSKIKEDDLEAEISKAA
jgi:hypothetical protein